MGFFSKKPRKGTVYTRAEALEIMHNFKSGALSDFTLIPQNVNGEVCYRIVTPKEERTIMEKLKDERNSIRRRNEFVKGIRENISREYKPNPGFKSYGNYGKLNDYDISR